LPHKLIAIPRRHEDITDDEVGALDPRHLKCLCTVASLKHMVFIVLEQDDQKCPIDSMVVHHPYNRHTQDSPAVSEQP
jgi:hypothetical protein